MMLVTSALLPASCVTMLPQKFSATTTCGLACEPDAHDFDDPEAHAPKRTTTTSAYVIAPGAVAQPRPRLDRFVTLVFFRSGIRLEAPAQHITRTVLILPTYVHSRDRVTRRRS